MSTVNLCHYLFQKNAKDIFPKFQENFIEECLRISMQVNNYLFSQSNTLPLYSSKAGNEGCHLYAYRIVQLKKTSNTLQALELNDDNRFLMLSLFLSFILLANDNKNLINVFNKTLKTLSLKSSMPNKFKAFLLDEGKYRENAARIAYNTCFSIYIKNKLDLSQNTDDLQHELYRLSQENLDRETKAFKKVILYTYPTFPALLFLEKKIEAEKLPLAIKIKVITEQGILGTLIKVFGNAEEHEPTLVFEGIATESMSVSSFREEALKCSKYYRRYENTHLRHKDIDTCKLCKPFEDAKRLENFKQKFEEATKSRELLLKALAVDSQELQKDFSNLFNQIQYPELTKISKQMTPIIQELGLSTKQPTTFSLCHAHVKTFKDANNTQLFLDTPPEAFLKQIGF